MRLEIFQKFHEIFKYFKVKYFIVHLRLQQTDITSFMTVIRRLENLFVARSSGDVGRRMFLSSSLLNPLMHSRLHCRQRR